MCARRRLVLEVPTGARKPKKRDPTPSPATHTRPGLLHRRPSAPHVARADVTPGPSPPPPPRARNAETPWNAASLLNRGCCWGAAAPLIGWPSGANQQRHREPLPPPVPLCQSRAGVTETSLPSKQPPPIPTPLRAEHQAPGPGCGRLRTEFPNGAPAPRGTHLFP